MNIYTKWFTVFCSIVIISFTVVTCDNNESNIEVLDDGLVSVNGHDLLLVENPDTEDDLWVVAGDRSGEGIGVLVEHDTANDNTTLYGAVYMGADGTSFAMMLDGDGYPASITFDDGSKITLSNYSGSTADVSFFDATGTILATQNVDLGDEFTELQNTLSEFGLTFDTGGVEAKSMISIPGGSITIYANEAHLSAIRGVFRITGTAISVVACAGSAVALVVPGGQVSAPLAAIACASAAAGVLSTIDYYMYNTDMGQKLGLGSTVISAVSCAGRNPADCATFLLAVFEGMLPNCTVSKRHHHKGCLEGNVYWYNDCNILQEVLEHCEHGCVNGACLPFDPNIEVNIGADPVCAQPGDTVFFSSQVSGGDNNTYMYTWDFEHGGEEYLDAVSHKFPDPGRYTVSLKVEDSSGNKGFYAVEVQVGDCDEIRASISTNPFCADKDQLVGFSAEVIGGDNLSYNYSWNFGDGSISTRPAPVHTYDQEQMYPVTLTVKDKNGYMDRVQTSVQVGGCEEEVDNETAEDCAAGEICDDGMDNDCDNATDCDDSDCDDDPACQPTCWSEDGRHELCRENDCDIPEITEMMCWSGEGRHETCRSNGCEPQPPCYWEETIVQGYVPCYWE